MKRKPKPPKKRYIPRPDFRNVARGAEELAKMIRESEAKDKGKEER